MSSNTRQINKRLVTLGLMLIIWVGIIASQPYIGHLPSEVTQVHEAGNDGLYKYHFYIHPDDNNIYTMVKDLKFEFWCYTKRRADGWLDSSGNLVHLYKLETLDRITVFHILEKRFDELYEQQHQQRMEKDAQRRRANWEQDNRLFQYQNSKCLSRGNNNNVIILFCFNDPDSFDIPYIKAQLDSIGVIGSSLYNYYHSISHNQLILVAHIHTYQDAININYYRLYCHTNSMGSTNLGQQWNREQLLVWRTVLTLHNQYLIPYSMSIDMDNNHGMDSLVFIYKDRLNNFGQNTRSTSSADPVYINNELS